MHWSSLFDKERIQRSQQLEIFVSFHCSLICGDTKRKNTITKLKLWMQRSLLSGGRNVKNMWYAVSTTFITQTDRGSCGWIIWHCRYYKEKSLEKMFFKKRPKRGETQREIISVCNRMRKAWMITLISRFSVPYCSIWRLLSLRARPWLRACEQV